MNNFFEPPLPFFVPPHSPPTHTPQFLVEDFIITFELPDSYTQKTVNVGELLQTSRYLVQPEIDPSRCIKRLRSRLPFARKNCTVLRKTNDNYSTREPVPL